MKLLVLDPHSGDLSHSHTDELPRFFRPGDLLVLNDAATLPASLWARTARDEAVEIRLVSALDDGSFHAVLFGAGTWRVPTEERDTPPRVGDGEELVLSPLLRAKVRSHESSERWVTLRFNLGGAKLFSEIYRIGRPIQYSYVHEELELWSVQNAYSGKPWAMEMPSAGRPLRWGLLLEMKRKGVEIAWLTHAAGISSTGDEELDRRLPVAEKYEIPATTMDAIVRARSRGGRVIAVGTSVVRALEGSRLSSGRLRAASGWTDLKIDPSFRLQVVDGILSGIHEPKESHYGLLGAFASRPQLEAVTRVASASQYRGHEFGDSFLILPFRSTLSSRGGSVKQVS